MSRSRLLLPARKAIAVVAALAVLTSGLNASPAAATDPGEPTVPDAVMSGKGSGPAPVQRSGSAGGKAALVTSDAPTTERPPSLRTMFPLNPSSGAEQPAQQISIPQAEEPKPVKGFDAATSREMPEKRGEFVQSFRNVDGTQTTAFSLAPANYQRADGSWAPVDMTLRPDAGDWLASTLPSPVRFAGRLIGGAAAATLTLDEDHEFAWSVYGARSVVAQVSGSQAVYAGIAHDTDLELVAQTTGVKETIVLRSKAVARSFAFPLRLKGLTAHLVAGDVVLRDKDGNQRVVIPAGSMEDSAKVSSKGVSYRLDTIDGAPALRVDVDDAWLDDPARKYPVRVDPTGLVTKGWDSNYAVTVRPGGAELGDQKLELGWKNGAPSAAYLSFGQVSSGSDHIAYHRILGANLIVMSYDAPTCAERWVRLHGVKQQWQTTPREQLRFPGPAVHAALTGRGFANGYIKPGQTKSACAARWQTLSMNSPAAIRLIQDWVDQKGNYGLALRAASETDPMAWKSFIGTGSPANPPKLYVTHTPYNAWYNVHRYQDPLNDAVLQDRGGKIPVTVKNTGPVTFTPATHYMSYRIFDAAGRRVGAGTEWGTALPGDIVRTAYRTFKVNVQPLPGSDQGTPYAIEFTMVHKTPSGNRAFTDELVPPGRAIIEVFNIPPRFTRVWPVNGYQSPILTPNLWASAVDDDSSDTSVTYKFDICEVGSNPTICHTSGNFSSSKSWTIPSGKLLWNKHYWWRAFARDNDGQVTEGPLVNLFTNVPQPPITSKIANSPLGTADKPFDPQVGNFTTSAMDAAVPVAGPGLEVVRTYNSLDPRRDRAFGAGWSSLLDMELASLGDGNVLVTYPDGQQVRVGKNPDGKYVAPPNRKATLIKETSGAWSLKAGAGTSYLFASNGRLQKVIGSNGLELVFAYRTDGTLESVTSTNGGSGRKLSFTWTADKRHVASVSTDPVDGAPLTWTYTYASDVLTKVCNPSNDCTSYESAQGSHYRSAVMDAQPESYYRLSDEDDPDADDAVSEVDINGGKDVARYRGLVGRKSAGALTGTDDKSIFLQGRWPDLEGWVELPVGQLRQSRDGAVEMWFKTNSTPVPLLGYQNAPLTMGMDPNVPGMPALYIGTDGKLRGNFWNSKYTPITSGQAVNDNQWHHVALSVTSATQTMYLDGARVGTLAGVVNNDPFAYNQVGAAYATSPQSWPGWGTAKVQYFAGQIDEVAIYSHPLHAEDVWAHWTHARTAADQTTSVTSLDGRERSKVIYDTTLDRVREITDDNGGTWKIHAPYTVATNTDAVRSVAVEGPNDQEFGYEYDGLGGWLLGQTRTALVAGGGSPRILLRQSYTRDAKGQLTKVTNELGHSVSMTYDARGNVTSKKACRTGNTDCHTEYTSYHFSAAWPEGDPRLDKPYEIRDGRSSGPTDDTYRTVASYTAGGDLSLQKLADSGEVAYTYTAGTEPSSDGKTMPKGLVRTVKDQVGAVTTYDYLATGQLAQVAKPSGLRVKYTYDAVGRKLTETEISDSHPTGVTNTYTYDKASRVRTVTGPETIDAVSGDRHRQRVEMEYNADGLVTKTTATDVVAGGEPRVTTIGYDDNGRATQVVDAAGNDTSSEYDGAGNLVRTKDANDVVREYSYNELNQLLEARLRDPGGTDPEAVQVLQSIGYDYAGRKARETDAMGRTTEFTYWDDDQLKRATLRDFHNPDGSTRAFVLEANDYDGAGNLVSRSVDDGKSTTGYVYDAVGRVTRQTTGGGPAIPPTNISRTEQYTYDLAGRRTRLVASGVWSNVPDPKPTPTTPRTTDYAYDVAGRKTSETLTNSPSPALVTSWTYDQRGLVLSSTSPRGNAVGAVKADFTTTYFYDELGRQVKAVAPKVAVEQNGGQPVESSPTTFTGYGAFGLVTSVKDARGNVTNTSYDKVGRPVETIAPAYTPPGGTPTSPKTRFEYDAGGQVTASIDERGNVTRFAYDKRGRRTTVDMPASTNDERAVTRYEYFDNDEIAAVTDPIGARQQWTYDDLDRKVTHTVVDRKPTTANFTTTWVYDDRDNVTSVKAPTGATSANEYDGVSQLVRSTDPNGVVTNFTYDPLGNLAKVTDAMGRSTRNEFDLAGRMVATAKYDAADTALGTRRLSYDADDNLVSQVPAGGGRATTYAYDALGRLTRQVDPVTGTASVTTGFGYDAAGNRTRFTDGRGNSTIYTINSLDLLESVIEPSTVAHPAVADRTWTASYDTAGNPVSLLSPGGVRRTRMFDAAGRLTKEEGTGAEVATVTRELGYDLASRLTTHSSYNGVNTQTYNDRGLMLRSDGPSGTASYGYNPDGLLTQRIDAAGTADFTYDKGRLATATDPVTRTVHMVGYNAAGQLASIDYSAGRVRAIGYDPFGRVNSDVLKNSSGTVVSSQIYGYDADDRITSKKTAGVAGSGEHTYTYDELGRLTTWQVGAKTVEYGWDAASNRTSVKTSAGEQVARFDERNRLISDGVSDYSYSPRGAVLSVTTGSTTESFSFDAFDRLIELSDRDYSYDALDRPVAIAATSPTRSTVRMRYAGFSDEVVTDGTQSFGRGAGDELLSLAYDTTKRLVLSDRHGDAIGGFDPADTTLTAGLPDTRTFDPWGKSTASSGLKYRIGYQGDWTDPRSGEVQMAARWYDPDTGTFDSRDTVSHSAGVPASFPNLYAYAAGNPINNNDPTGNRPAPEPSGDCYYDLVRDPTSDLGWRWKRICPPKNKPKPCEQNPSFCKTKCQKNPNACKSKCEKNPSACKSKCEKNPKKCKRIPCNKRNSKDCGGGEDNTCKRPPCKQTPPPCGVECKEKITEEAKDEIEDDLFNNPILVPIGVADPECPPANRMCHGRPDTPAPETSDTEIVGDGGSTEQFIDYATRTGPGVLGRAGLGSSGCGLCMGMLPGGDSFRETGGAGVGIGGGGAIGTGLGWALVEAWKSTSVVGPIDGIIRAIGGSGGGTAEPPDDDGPHVGGGRDPDDIRGPGPGGGESTAAARGRQAHADWNYGPGFRKEFELPSGRRADAVNLRTREVIELKPNNPRAIREGQRQLQRYIDELNRVHPGKTPWTGRVVTYNP